MVAIPRLTGKRTRRAYIYLPDSYYKNTQKCYAVMYMFDGHNVFFDCDATYGKSWGMSRYLDETKKEVKKLWQSLNSLAQIAR